MSEAVKNRLKQKAVEKQIDLAGVNLKEDEKALFEEMGVKTLAEKSNLRTLVQQLQTEAVAVATNTTPTGTATGTTTANTTANTTATTTANTTANTTAASASTSTSTSTNSKKRGKATKKGRKGVPTMTKTKPKKITTPTRSSDGASSGGASSKGTASPSTSTSTSTSTIASGLRKAKKGRKGVQCRNLSNEQRASLLQSLLKHKMSSSNGSGLKNSSSNGSGLKNSSTTTTTTTINSNNNSNSSSSSSILHHKLRKGALLEASRSFGVSTKTCKRIWERFLETSDDKGSGGDVSHRKHQSGRPKKISSVELLTKIASLPKETRSSVRGLARALGMPHTTIHRRLKSGEIQLEGLSEAYSGKKKNGKGATPNDNDNDNDNEDVDENEKEKGIILSATTVGNH